MTGPPALQSGGQCSCTKVTFGYHTGTLPIRVQTNSGSGVVEAGEAGATREAVEGEVKRERQEVQSMASPDRLAHPE